jgi:hypothetical protein
MVVSVVDGCPSAAETGTAAPFCRQLSGLPLLLVLLLLMILLLLP